MATIPSIKKTRIIKSKKTTWRRLHKGVFLKHLSRDKESGMYVSLFKIQPSTSLALHTHPQFEWAYVLKGDFCDQFGTVRESDLIINAAGSSHASFSKKGCTLLVYWCGKHMPAQHVQTSV